MSTPELTDEEERAIASLRRLAKKWPKSLWLFSAAGTLNVMKKGEDGTRQYVGSGVDASYCIDTIDIENDGGDW